MKVRTLIASPQFGGDLPHDDSRVAHYESQVSFFLQRLDAMSHDLPSCKARLDAREKKYTYLETQMGQFESSYSPPARVIPALQSAISNSIKVQGELDARVQKMESGVPSHHTGNIDGLISKVDKMHLRCEDLDNGLNGIHDVIDGLKTSQDAGMVALETNVAPSLRDNTANVTRAYENTIGDLRLQMETKYEVLSSRFATLEAGDNTRRVDAIDKRLEDVEKKISLHVGILHEASSSASPPNPPPNPPPHSFDVPMFATKIKTLDDRMHQLELAGQIEQGPVPVDVSSAVRELEDKCGCIIERFQVQALEREKTLEFRLPDACDARESKFLAKIEELQAQISLRGVGNSTTQGNSDGDHRNNNGAPSQERTQVPIWCAPSAHVPFGHTPYATNSHNNEASNTSSTPHPFPPPPAPSPPPPSPPTPQQPPSQTAWLLDEEGKIIPSRALTNTEKRDIIPSGVPDGDLAFPEVRQVSVGFTPQSVPEGQQYQVDGNHGVFSSKPDSWIDPADIPTLQKQYRNPLYDPEKQPLSDWLVLYRDWYDICGFRFSADMQKRILVSTQPADQQELLGEQLLREKLTFQQLWHIVSAFGMRVSNPYVAKRVWEALPLEGDVGPEEWYKLFTRFTGHGRQVRGGVTQWDAHSHITRIICESCKGIAHVHGEKHHPG